MAAQSSATKSKLLKRSAASAAPEINVTPLVDVVLVLLIIFMVIAPALNEGAQIELPKVLTPDPKPRDISPINLLIAPDGSLSVNDERVQSAQLTSKLIELHAREPGRSLLLKADERTPYIKVREAFREVQKVGFKGVLLKVAEKKAAGSAS